MCEWLCQCVYESGCVFVWMSACVHGCMCVSAMACMYVVRGKIVGVRSLLSPYVGSELNSGNEFFTATHEPSHQQLFLVFGLQH